MLFSTKRIWSVVGACAVLTSAYVGSTEKPAAAYTAGECLQAGFLCLYDSDKGSYGRLEDWNADWNAFGWGGRADSFNNHGRTHNSCIYPQTSYWGFPLYVPRNATWVSSRNFGQSNSWTRDSFCKVQR